MSTQQEAAVAPRNPELWEALVPVVALIAILGVNIFVFHSEYHQLPLILAAAVAAIMGTRLRHSWKHMEDGMIKGIMIGVKATMILLIIGMMIGTWIASGVVPLLIHYGLKILNPSIFLVACCLICVVVSLATGSSWTTAGTVGIALVGVGQALSVSPAMTAGAIISGAYFGDKMSPLSDTTNLAPAVAGSDLFEHIWHMIYTTLPALIIALVLYGLLGMNINVAAGVGEDVATIGAAIENGFKLNPLLLIPPALVIGMVVFRVPALPALLAGAVAGGILAVVLQGVSVQAVFDAAINGYTSETGVEAVDKLLSRGGLLGMMATVALIICALAFGGIMERTGLLSRLADAILSLAKSTGSLIMATVGTCIGVNALAPEQYLSIVVPGRMYAGAYQSQGLHSKNLSRTLEDAGTMTSPLIPWNSCGAFMGATLTVTPLAYAPYAFVNLLCPLIAIILGFTGWKIAKADAPKAE
jgi:Na+:H+ antiporter, NhaC family